MKAYRRIVILLLSAVIAASSWSQSVYAENTYPLNINTATAEQIAQALDGVGEVRAEAIVLLREQLDGFTSVDQLLDVSGIGEVTLERIRSLIVLE